MLVMCIFIISNKARDPVIIIITAFGYIYNIIYCELIPVLHNGIVELLDSKLSFSRPRRDY